LQPREVLVPDLEFSTGGDVQMTLLMNENDVYVFRYEADPGASCMRNPVLLPG
jgi:hypothetical protein